MYDDADPNDAMAGNIPLKFEHERMKYEVNVWNEAALNEVHQNQQQYLDKVLAGSE